MGLNPDRTRMSQLVAAEMKYFGNQYALPVVVGSTTLVSMVAVLFAVFYYIGQPAAAAREYVYLVVSIVAFSAFLLSYFVYRIATKINGVQYNIVMGFTAFCYFICSISGFIFARIAWMWQVYEISQGDYNRYINTIFSWCFLAPLLLIVFYFAIVYVFVDFPLPYIGWSFNFYAFVPISILIMVAMAARISTAETSFPIAIICALSYISLMLMLVIHFLFKLVLNNVLVSTPARYETFVKARRSVPKPNEKKITGLDLRAAAEKVKHGENPNKVAAETLDIHTPSATMPEIPAYEPRRPIFEKLAPAISLYKSETNPEINDSTKNQNPISDAFTKLREAMTSFIATLKQKITLLAKDKSDALASAKALQESTSSPAAQLATESKLAVTTVDENIKSITKLAKEPAILADDSVTASESDKPLVAAEAAKAAEQPIAASIGEQAPAHGIDLVDEILGSVSEATELPTESKPVVFSSTNKQSADKPKFDMAKTIDLIKSWINNSKKSITDYINEFKMPIESSKPNNSFELNKSSAPQTTTDALSANTTANQEQSHADTDEKPSVKQELKPSEPVGAAAVQASVPKADAVVTPIAEKQPETKIKEANSNTESVVTEPKPKNHIYESPNKTKPDLKAKNDSGFPKKYVMPDAYKYNALEGFVMEIKPAPVRKKKADQIANITVEQVQEPSKNVTIPVEVLVSSEEIIATNSADVVVALTATDASNVDDTKNSDKSEELSDTKKAVYESKGTLEKTLRDTVFKTSDKNSNAKQKANIFKASQNNPISNSKDLENTEKKDLEINEVIGTGIEAKQKPLTITDEMKPDESISTKSAKDFSSTVVSFFELIKAKFVSPNSKIDTSTLMPQSNEDDVAQSQPEPKTTIESLVQDKNVKPGAQNTSKPEPVVTSNEPIKNNPSRVTPVIATHKQTHSQDKLTDKQSLSISQKNRDWFEEIQSQLGLFTTDTKTVKPFKNDEPDIVEQLEEPNNRIVERTAQAMHGADEELVEVMEDVVLVKPQGEDKVVQASTVTPPLESSPNNKIEQPSSSIVVTTRATGQEKTRVVVKPVRHDRQER